MSALAAPGSLKDQIKSLLKANLKPGIVADHVGCDPSYVSQLLTDPDFAAEVLAAKSKLIANNVARDSTYDEIEDLLLEGLKGKVVNGAGFMKTETLLRSIQVINQAKRRTIGSEISGGSVTNIQNIIQLTMPAHALRQFQVNSNNEVIAVGAQELISMPAKQLLTLARTAITESKEIKTIESKKIPDKEFPNGLEQQTTLSRVTEATVSAYEV